MLVGVDIGGTFTDLVLSLDGTLKIHKLLSSPNNPAEAMLQGLKEISPTDLQAFTQIAHGSTVATNAILERKGTKTALITTQGFRDILYIGRQDRPNLYALYPQISPPLIPREYCFEVPERLDFEGNILLDLDLTALDTILDTIAKEDIQSVAVCFLFSYVKPIHERMVRDRILQRKLLSDWQVALSSDVLPEFREYERASTVSLEAYVRPIMTRYIQHLGAKLPKETSLRIMKSDGGVMSATRVPQQAIQTALSGPAAGVIGAFHLARLAGYDCIITLDMGGTSTDVALCNGAPHQRPESEIDGLPLRVRLLDIETIGAGGGSIARLDDGGALRVGPESAGANPGPIVYGQGGTEITVSDANTILGRLDADHFLGGTMSLEENQAAQAFEQLARKMKMTIAESAKGVIDVANVNIDRAIRRVSIERGHDPRDFTLVAFGGAGALHACEVAERLQIPRVLIPRYPGVLCAFGLLVADVVLDYTQSVMLEANAEATLRLQKIEEVIAAHKREELRREGIPENKMQFHTSLDVRYQGQAYELNIPLTENIADRFHHEHKHTYGHDMPERLVEIVNIRLQAIGIVEKPILEPELVHETSARGANIGTKLTRLGTTIQLYDREKLVAGMTFEGEALLFQLDSTIYVPRQWSARVDAYYNLILEYSF